jgi:hypothetical protein
VIESSYAENHCTHCRFDHWVEDVEDPGDKEHGTYICLKSETRCVEDDNVVWMYILSRCVKAAEGSACGMFQREIGKTNMSKKTSFVFSKKSG